MLKAGVTRTRITPPVGVPIGGNVREDSTSRGVHDDLYANVTVLWDDGWVVMIGMDLLYVTEDMVQDIRAELATSYNIPRGNTVVWATHTHSGPDISSKYAPAVEAPSPLVTDWLGALPKKVGAAVGVAIDQAQFVSLRIGHCSVDGLSFNRRLMMKDGSVRMNWEGMDPDDVVRELGPIDPDLWTLGFESEEGELLGLLVHFTLHPAILVGEDWMLSRDYVHYLTESLQKRYGNQLTVMFANGALGNINHIDYRQVGHQKRGFVEAERIGNLLATYVASSIDSWTGTVRERVQVTQHRVRLLRRAITPEMVSESEQVLEASCGVIPSLVDGVPREAYAAMILKMAKGYHTEFDVEVSLVQVGPLLYVLVPAEVFVEFGLAIRKVSTESIVRVVSLAGGTIGYLPTSESFEQGGYEPTFGTSTIVRGQGEVLFEEIRNVISRILGG